MIDARMKPEPPDVVGNDKAYPGGCSVGHVALGKGDPVIAPRGLHRPVPLVDRDTDGMGVRHVMRLAIHVVTVHGPLRKLTDTHDIRLEEITQALDVPAQDGRILADIPFVVDIVICLREREKAAHQGLPDLVLTLFEQPFGWPKLTPVIFGYRMVSFIISFNVVRYLDRRLIDVSQAFHGVFSQFYFSLEDGGKVDLVFHHVPLRLLVH